jgi:hypothetical protein
MVTMRSAQRPPQIMHSSITVNHMLKANGTQVSLAQLVQLVQLVQALQLVPNKPGACRHGQHAEQSSTPHSKGPIGDRNHGNIHHSSLLADEFNSSAQPAVAMLQLCVTEDTHTVWV